MIRRAPSDRWVAVGILGILLGVIVIGALLNPQKQTLPPLSSRSTQPDGSQALYTWLAQLGYQVSNEPGSQFAVPAGTEAVFLLEPASTVSITDQEWKILDQFVESGGTLVAAGQGAGAASVDSHYGFSLAADPFNAGGTNHYINAFTPVLHSPLPDSSKIKLMAFHYLERAKFDYPPLLVENRHPYALSYPRGKGQVILVADQALFSNAGLKQYGAAELLLNLLAPVPRSARIWFDEWHHGERALETTRSGPEDWLIYTPGGQAVLWVLVVAFVGLVLGGRYFGRPLQAEKDVTRRAPLEYINALAGLNQRAGHRRDILRSYYHQLRRSLSQRYRLDPDLTDEELARCLAEMRQEVDPAALAALLKRLQRANPSEPEMVVLANQAAKAIQQIEQSGSVTPDPHRER